MGAKENLEIVEQLQEAVESGDWDAYGRLLADDVVVRMAGVPGALGGVTRGRDEAVAMMRRTPPQGRFEQRSTCADDTQVVMVGKFSAPSFAGNAFLRGSDKPWSTFECIVYRLDQGRVKESTSYINWLDVYTQVGLVDPASLTP